MDGLRGWFLEHRRSFPWRGDEVSAYAVLVSEMMLQQTQASVVVPYFEAWMQRFPTLEALAKASLQEVIKAWEGLGYYSRARYLHAGARLVMERYGGKIPSDEALLKTVKGLGPYTRGALLAFAFRQRAAAVDGNVIRVLARYFGISDDISKSLTINNLRSLAASILPQEEPWIHSEALIELGAVVCQKKPKCGKCPLRKGCIAYREGSQEEIPYKSKKIEYEKLFRDVFIITCGEEVLLSYSKEPGLMQGLYEFPYFPKIEGEEEALRAAAASLELPLAWRRSLGIFTQSFTRFRVTLRAFHAEASKKREVGFWVGVERLREYPFSSGHKRLLEKFLVG